MRTVYLLRHAKSSWDDPGLADRERPLAPRGVKAASRVAAHLARQRPRPDVVLCSSATRARQTWAVVAPALGEGVEVRIEDALYDADVAGLLAVLRGLSGDLRAVLLVGHNPAIQELALTLTGGDAPGRAGLGEKFPTGALARLAVSGPWGELGPGRAHLDEFVVPRDLPD